MHSNPYTIGHCNICIYDKLKKKETMHLTLCNGKEQSHCRGIHAACKTSRFPVIIELIACDNTGGHPTPALRLSRGKWLQACDFWNYICHPSCIFCPWVQQVVSFAAKPWSLSPFVADVRGVRLLISSFLVLPLRLGDHTPFRKRGKWPSLIRRDKKK